MAGTGICNLSHKENPKNFSHREKNAKSSYLEIFLWCRIQEYWEGKAGMNIYQEAVMGILYMSLGLNNGRQKRNKE